MHRRTFRYRLYPSKAQTKVLDEHLELCRNAYNQLLDHCKQQYKENGKTPTQFDLNNLLINLKQMRPEFSRIHSQVLQNISKRIRDAYTGFYARRRAGLKAGLPRFKKYGRYKSVTYPQSGFKIEGNKLNLSKIGNIRIRQHRELPEKIKTLMVKRMPSGRWYACFSCVVEAQPREKPFEDVGIDVGLNNYAMLSDGTRIENPRLYRNEEKRLGLLQRRSSKKERGSLNWVKAKTRVARLHERIQNRRTDFLHKESRKIADNYETVYFEDLKIGNMVRNHHLAKSISDAGWGRFIRMIAYKEEESGGQLIQVNPRGTTQMCSRCGEAVPKDLSQRIHRCPGCGLVMDRDHNAALNILARGREIGREPPESRPVEEGATTPSTMVQAYPVKQEVSLLVGR
ncbi:MAG: transposase [Candidatus Bathyarchaeota archaeon]|nr:transposase [Candidatus Bathyarchaeota archaeon]